jgi:thiosulfate/3-mercaptopyruvate sulfurtransferase
MRSRLAILSALVACSVLSLPAASPRDTLVVSTAWLAQHLSDASLVVLHAGDKPEYDARHVPGARFVALDDVAVSDHDGRGDGLMLQMPPADDLRTRLAALGISNNSRVIVYHTAKSFSSATRVLFTLDYAGLGGAASLLDGGLEAWARDGRPVSKDVPAPRIGTLTPLTITPEIVDAKYVLAHLKTPKVAIVDARTPAFYSGAQTGNSMGRPHRIGHISGAHNVPHTQVTDDQGRLKSPEELAALFAAAGVEPGDTIIGYCHIGQQASAMIFAARTLGFTVLLYDGSFEDWSTHADYPVDNPTSPAAGQGAAAAAPPAAGQGAAAATPPAAPPARPTAADQVAYTAAMKITEATGRLDALRKLQADFPSSSSAQNADNAILDLVLNNWPDRRQDVIQALDRIVANLPTAVGSADFRLTQVQGLVAKLVDKNVLLDKAEAMVGDAMEELDKQAKATRARAIETLGTIHLQRGDASRAEKEFKDALAANSTLSRAPLELGKMEAKRGNDKVALEYFLTAAVMARLKPADEDALRAAYKKVHGSDAGLDESLDKAYDAKFPNPVKTQPYVAPADRSTRLVVGEMFTGAGCGPCVSADLALEAVLHRYPADTIVALAYHANIPLPDPMVVSGAEVRRKYYNVNGVPTFHLDGVAVGNGGGARDNASRNYGDYTTTLDKQLQAAPSAAIVLRATTDGSQVKVTATVSKVAAGTKDPRLHLVLADPELRFMGENGIRYHEMVVRGVAGENATGFAVNAAGDTTVEYTFDLAAVKDDVTKSIADEIVKRRKTETPGTTPREYRAEGHAMVGIDPGTLVVVAFVQDADKRVLQGARASVTKAASER